ncbi:hypothetical protein GQ457_08G002570 [Hibiscus cannabinus]
MSQTNWEADKMLDLYIHDYLVKWNLKASAQAFQAEGKVSSDPVVLLLNMVSGYRCTWRTNEKHSQVAASYIETQLIKAREQQQQQPQHQQQQQQQQQLQMQQLLLQQQQRRDESHLLNGNTNGLVGNDSLIRHSAGTVNAMATKMYEERLKLPLQRDSLDDAAMKQSLRERLANLLDKCCTVQLVVCLHKFKLGVNNCQEHSGSSSKPMMMFGADGTGSLASPSNQLWDDKDLELKAEMDRFVDDGSLDDNVESFITHDDTDPRDAVGRCMDVTKGFSFMEVNFRASSSKVTCCHFSSDGKLLAAGGHDKKAVLWYSDTLKLKSTLEEHSGLITDVRFSPSMSRLATSSFDKTVRVWDADSPGYSLRTFMGHSSNVMSLDFHPTKDDLICSCDTILEYQQWELCKSFQGIILQSENISNSAIPLWGRCTAIKTVSFCVDRGGTAPGTAQSRFQSRLGKYLAAAAENVVSILDTETQTCRHSLQHD